MEIKVQMPFRKLLDIVRSLTSSQKARLRQELDKENPGEKNQDEFIEYLLNGPVYTNKEIEVIEENRKSISAWRTTAN